MPTLQHSSSNSPVTSESSQYGQARAGGTGARDRSSSRRGVKSPEDGASWLLCLGGGALLTILANSMEHYGFEAGRPVLIFFFLLSCIAALIPASGPRGQRVGMLPAVGLAAALILPPITASLPLLLANSLYAALRDTPAARRGVIGRGFWLVLAIVVSGLLHKIVWAGQPLPTPAAFLAPSALYLAIYVGGRQAGLRRNRTSWRKPWVGGRLETAGLVLSLPVIALTAVAASRVGVTGVILSSGLMALLLVIVSFGFEVAMLREQVRAMEKISAVTLSQTDPGRVIERFLQLSASLITCDRASFWLTDDSQTRLERVAKRQAYTGRRGPAQHGDTAASPALSMRFGEGYVGRVADRQVPIIIREGYRDPRLPVPESYSSASASGSLLLIPLVAGGETVGVAQFEREAPGFYSNRDVGRIRSLASQVAATIANVHMHRDVYNQAVTDGLTGLFNRRHMQSALIEERQRAARYSRSLSVIMLDVDEFKKYNDTYGHPQGDVLLKMTAALLRANVREVDVVGRYGGEEFIIVMPETSKAEAILTAERLRSAMAGTVFPGFADETGASGVYKTISLGLATYPEDSDDIQTLVSLADQALYRAKRGGRNQVVATDAPGAQPAGDHPSSDVDAA